LPRNDREIVLEWARDDGGGNVYRWKEKDMAVPGTSSLLLRTTGEAVRPGKGGGIRRTLEVDRARSNRCTKAKLRLLAP
jgi:hypothetical protein